MKALVLAVTFAAGIGGGGGAALPTPVLVELFTSEGCSSCPAADVLLATLFETQPIPGAQVVPLELHVDYWDRLGWKDPYSSAAYTRRQENYAQVFGGDRVYTPQMIVDGAMEFTGSDADRAAAAIREAAARPHMSVGVSAEIRRETIRINIDAPPAPQDSEKIVAVIAVVEDGLESAVKRGENAGRTLRHTAVTRRLETVGTLDRDAFAGEGQWKLNPGWVRANLRVVAFLQGEQTRRVYGAAQAPVR